MNTVVLGLGSAGSRHTFNAKKLGKEVVAFADPKITGLGEVLENVAAYDDPYACLAEYGAGSAVIVAAPTFFHHDLSLAAIDAGCRALLIEKPGGMTTGEVGIIKSAAETMGVRVAVGYNFRYNKAIKELSSLGVAPCVLSAVGIDQITAWPSYSPESWLVNKEMGGGIVNVSSPHAIDIALYLQGPVNNVAVFYDTEDGPPDEYLLVRLKHEYGGISSLYNRWTGAVGMASTISATRYDFSISVDLLRQKNLKTAQTMHLEMLGEFYTYAESGRREKICTIDQAIEIRKVVDQVENLIKEAA